MTTIAKYQTWIATIPLALGVLSAASANPIIIDSFFSENPGTQSGYLGSHSVPNLWKLTTSGDVSIAEDAHKIKFTAAAGGFGYMHTELVDGIDIFSAEGVKFQFYGARLSSQELSAPSLAYYKLVVGSEGNAYWSNIDDGFRVVFTEAKKMWFYFKKNGVQTTLVNGASLSNHVHSVELRLWDKNAYDGKLNYHLWISHQSLDNSWAGDDYSSDGYYGEVVIAASDWGDTVPTEKAAVNFSVQNGENDGAATVSLEVAEFNIWPGDCDASDTIVQKMPPGYTDAASYLLGYLDVTKAPYNAVGDGLADDTDALNQVMMDAYDYDLAVYLPAGMTFLVSDTLHIARKTYMKVGFSDGTAYKYYKDACFSGSRGKGAAVVIGGKGTKPVIRLADYSPGFDTPGTPKPVVALYTVSVGENDNIAYKEDYRFDQANIGFDNTLRGVKIVCGNNAGATGLRYGGAQGSTVEDLEIDATGAYVGLHGMSGVAGGMHNIKITGGDIGILADDEIDGRAPHLAGIVLHDQVERAIKYSYPSAGTSIAGLEIRKEGGVAIEALGQDKWIRPGQGNLSIIDGIIEFTKGSTWNVAYQNSDTNTLYLQNVYVKNADRLVAEGTKPEIAGNPSGWALIQEYANLGIDQHRNDLSTPVAVIDGVVHAEANTIVLSNVMASAMAPTSDYVSLHVWDESTFPTSDDANLLNVMDQDGDGIYFEPGDAQGDDETDDTVAIQQAIDTGAAANRTVYVPKGNYRVSNPIVVRKHSRLIGLKTFSQLRPIKGSGSGTWIGNGHALKAVITTDDAVDATAQVGFLAPVFYPLDTRNGGWEWKLGRNSILRNPNVFVADYWGTYASNDTVLYSFSGHGGGMIHGPSAHEGAGKWWAIHPNFRMALIEGTSEPLRIYGLNPERIFGDYQAEIRSSTNVFLLGLKCEENSPMLGIVDSHNIMVVGHDIAGSHVFDVIDSEDVTIAGSTAFLWDDVLRVTNLTEFRDGSERVRIENASVLSVFKRGEARLIRWAELPASIQALLGFQDGYPAISWEPHLTGLEYAVGFAEALNPSHTVWNVLGISAPGETTMVHSNATNHTYFYRVIAAPAETE